MRSTTARPIRTAAFLFPPGMLGGYPLPNEDGAAGSTDQQHALLQQCLCRPPGGTFDGGTEVILAATAEEGHILDHWDGDLASQAHVMTINRFFRARRPILRSAQ